MRVRLGLVGVVVLATSAAAQSSARPWQSLSLPTAEQVRRVWAEPPSEYGPEPYYGLNGKVTVESVDRDLDTMHSLGFRAVTVQYGAGSGREYLSAEYMEFFRQFVLEAKKRDMRVWIVDDAGYPSGFAGGKFTSEHPELRMQALVATAKVAVKAGEVFDQSVGADTVAVTAVRKDGQVAQIAYEGRHAKWTATSGDWTVYVVEHAFRTSPTRSDTNSTHAKDTTQSLEDYLNPAATAQYLAFTHETYKKAVGDEFGKTVLGFRGDEPDYSLNGLPWTPRFFAQFEAKKGYDIRPYLAVFLQAKDVVLTPEQLRARADYYDVFANMFRDGFFKPQGDWCAANGLEYQVHLNHEEMQLQLAHSEGDFFRDMRYVQVPGIDSIWHQIWTDTISDFPRFASSAAHVYGHPRAFTESFAAYRPAPDITMARYILNEQLVRGVNLVEAMYYPSSATPGRGGPSAVMSDPGWPALMQYTRRMSYLMSMGHPAAEVGLLLPAESLWMGETKADETFVSAERMLSEHQVDFDIVDEDAIDSVLKMEKGAFVSSSGNRYRTILVPHASLLPAAMVERLHRFAGAGGRVVFLGAFPEFVSERANLHARKVTAREFSWATIIAGDLPATPTPPAQPPADAPGPQVLPEGFLQAVKKALPANKLALEHEDKAVRLTHRKLADATVVLLFNESSEMVENALEVQGRMTVERWDATSAQSISAQDASFIEGKTRVPLKLAPYTTEIVVLSSH